MKLLAEAKKIDDLSTKVIMDMAQLRTLESEVAASKVRRKFFKENIPRGCMSSAKLSTMRMTPF
jgi:hypothetical protein